MKQNSIVKEQALRIEPNAEAHGDEEAYRNPSASIAATNDGAIAEELDNHIIMAVEAANDKKAIDMIALDLRSLASFTDYFLITSGSNTRQVQAIADSVVDQLKKVGRRPARVEGYNSAEWVLVDYGDFIIHVFDDKARRFYDLERLWREATRVKLPSDEIATVVVVSGEPETNAPGDNGSEGSEENEQP
jgi:ribosome-associated protein